MLVSNNTGLVTSAEDQRTNPFPLLAGAGVAGATWLGMWPYKFRPGTATGFPRLQGLQKLAREGLLMTGAGGRGGFWEAAKYGPGFTVAGQGEFPAGFKGAVYTFGEPSRAMREAAARRGVSLISSQSEIMDKLAEQRYMESRALRLGKSYKKSLSPLGRAYTETLERMFGREYMETLDVPRGRLTKLGYIPAVGLGESAARGAEFLPELAGYKPTAIPKGVASDAYGVLAGLSTGRVGTPPRVAELIPAIFAHGKEREFVLKKMRSAMGEGVWLGLEKVPQEVWRDVERGAESYMLQRRIRLADEYRVVVAGERAVYTAHRFGPRWLQGILKRFGNIPMAEREMKTGTRLHITENIWPVFGERRRELEEFAKRMGKVSPYDIVALDIGVTEAGKLQLIEAQRQFGTIRNPVVSRRLRYLLAGKRHPVDMAIAAGLGLLAFGMASIFSGKDDNYNTIEALQHRGMAGATRSVNTDFGSGYSQSFRSIKVAKPLEHLTEGELDQIAAHLNRKISAAQANPSMVIGGISSIQHDLDLIERIRGGARAVPKGVRSWATSLRGNFMLGGLTDKSSSLLSSNSWSIARVGPKKLAPQGFMLGELADKSSALFSPSQWAIAPKAGTVTREAIREAAIRRGIRTGGIKFAGRYWKYGLAGLAAATLFGFAFSGKDDEYNTIEVLQHRGAAGATRPIATDFGSGWRGVKNAFEKLGDVLRGIRRTTGLGRIAPAAADVPVVPISRRLVGKLSGGGAAFVRDPAALARELEAGMQGFTGRTRRQAQRLLERTRQIAGSRVGQERGFILLPRGTRRFGKEHEAIHAIFHRLPEEKRVHLMGQIKALIGDARFTSAKIAVRAKGWRTGALYRGFSDDVIAEEALAYLLPKSATRAGEIRALIPGSYTQVEGLMSSGIADEIRKFYGFGSGWQGIVDQFGKSIFRRFARQIEGADIPNLKVAGDFFVPAEAKPIQEVIRETIPEWSAPTPLYANLPSPALFQSVPDRRSMPIAEVSLATGGRAKIAEPVGGGYLQTVMEGLDDVTADAASSRRLLTEAERGQRAGMHQKQYTKAMQRIAYQSSVVGIPHIAHNAAVKGHTNMGYNGYSSEIIRMFNGVA